MPRAATERVRTVILRTPQLPCVVPPAVFDAFGWCASDVLEWRHTTTRRENAETAVGTETAAKGARLDGSNPPGMAFVMRQPLGFLPCELARLHVFGLGLDGEMALAPWAIDEATDSLYDQRARPRECFWLAASNIDALFWGLHDWAHFHSHGPFTERAWTELQCDLSALAWLWINRDAAELDESAWDTMRSQAESLSRTRFATDGLAFDATLLGAARIASLATGAPFRVEISEAG
jgi:hypothetical protein